jgi:hypothetical protein
LATQQRKTADEGNDPDHYLHKDKVEEVIEEKASIREWRPEESHNPHYIHLGKWVFRYDDEYQMDLEAVKFLEGEITDG